MKPYKRRALTLAFLIGVCIIACQQGDSEIPKHYKIVHKVISQPINHANLDGPKLEQEITILIPDGAPADSPVFFNLGNEADQTDEGLAKLYEQYGGGSQIIYVQVEHRGYGQSLTADEDQSMPSYVQIDQALADAHSAVQELKKEYSGPWMAAGWSYGGGLVINYAAAYPDDVRVILSSSGVIDWPCMNYAYDRRVRTTLGDACYKRVAKHARNLQPKELFDNNWMQREFMYANVVGVCQYERFKNLLPYFRLASYLPTGPFLKLLHWLDHKYGKDKAWEYASGFGARHLSREEALSGSYNWRVWHYQQCAQTGVFFASEEPDGLFSRTRDEECEECRALFGEDLPCEPASEWSPRKMLEALTTPLVYVAGGEDPWFALCLKPDYKLKSGKYFYVPTGRHCPDRDDPKLGQQVLAEMLKYAQAKP